MNLILVYPKRNIVNNHVDYKSISIFVTQKKGMPVLCKSDSFKTRYNHSCIQTSYALSQYCG